MKTKRRLLIACGVLVVLLLAACFVGCDADGGEGDCDHVWGEWTTIKGATCVSEGRNKRQCEKCGEIENEIIEALPHTPIDDDGDCTTPITCTVCRGVITEATEHSGGEATCSAKATCAVCGKEYGELLPHTPEADDGDCTTEIVCTVCGVITTEATAGHTGGAATCIELAHCSVCSMEYGEYADHAPNADDGNCTTPITCSVCNAITTEAREAHTGGEATCYARAVCEVCNMEYGALLPHTPNEDDGDCTTAVTCSICEAIIVPARESHTGGEATCYGLPACEVCGMEYGELLPHTPVEDDGNCTTAVTCAICDAVTTPAREAHTGGTETCYALPACEVCGMEYGNLLPHTPIEDDGDCTTEVTCSICNAVTTAARACHTGGTATCYAPAACEVCSTEYGELLPHTPVADDDDCMTPITCSVCDAVTTPARESHTGGQAACYALATCEICGKEYGDFLPHTPREDDGDCTTAITCEVCNAITTPARPVHIGGTATCVELAVCSVCSMEYGAYAAHVPQADDGDCTTAVICSICDAVTTPAREAHSGGTATCVAKARCAVCNREYGELAPHSEATVWIKHIDEHYLAYACCRQQISEAEAHTRVDGVCTVCGYNPTITMSSAEASPGDTRVSVTLSIEDNPGIAGLMVSVTYSSDALLLAGVESGEALAPLTFTRPGALESGCTFMWDCVEIPDQDIRDGVMLTLIFDVSADAYDGEYSILLSVNAYDNDLRPFTLIITGGTITVSHN